MLAAGLALSLHSVDGRCSPIWASDSSMRGHRAIPVRCARVVQAFTVFDKESNGKLATA